MKTKTLTLTPGIPLLISGIEMFSNSRLFSSEPQGCQVISISVEVPEDFNGIIAFSAPAAVQSQQWKERLEKEAGIVFCDVCKETAEGPIIVIEDVGCSNCGAGPGCMKRQHVPRAEIYMGVLQEKKGG